MRITTLILTAALWATASAASAQMVVLVRHAEKADASSDPALSEAGTARAVALAAGFEGEGPDLVLVSALRRTGLTAAPTVSLHGSTVRTFGLEAGADAHVAAIVAEIRAQPATARVLVVGHSNTIPLIVRALGVESADMPDCEYDRLTAVDLNGATPVGAVVRYGAPSTC